MERETLLEKYIQGELTENERVEFDSLVEKDADFLKEVAFHTNLKKVIEAEDDAVFREMVSDFESEARTETTKRKRFPTKWLVAASIALIAGLTYFLPLNTTTSPQELYAQNFEPYRNVVHPITRGEADQDEKTKAFMAYQNGKYEEALPMFTELYNDTEESYFLFYKANALIQLNRAREAIPILQAHLQRKGELSDKTTWYLAMAYLQLGDKENAKIMLDDVIENGNYKVESAQQILKDLE
ncbi:MAG: hypothetical protein HKN31_04460 [Pricia sp.]|nr:hypothetical protein [Pricia sp.]